MSVPKLHSARHYLVGHSNSLTGFRIHSDDLFLLRDTCEELIPLEERDLFALMFCFFNIQSYSGIEAFALLTQMEFFIEDYYPNLSSARQSDFLMIYNNAKYQAQKESQISIIAGIRA